MEGIVLTQTKGKNPWEGRVCEGKAQGLGNESEEAAGWFGVAQKQTRIGLAMLVPEYLLTA